MNQSILLDYHVEISLIVLVKITMASPPTQLPESPPCITISLMNNLLLVVRTSRELIWVLKSWIANFREIF